VSHFTAIAEIPRQGTGQGRPYIDLENLARTLGNRLDGRALAVTNDKERERLRLLRDVALKIANCLSGTGTK
jgi:hypothetical protein